MKNTNREILNEDTIKNRIHTLRGRQIIIDRDLAELYQVKTKRLNEQVKRNIERFPEDFMFELNENEKNELVAKCDRLAVLKYSSAVPLAFTEHGIAALSGVLKSKKAVQVNIRIIREFIFMRKFISENAGIFQRLDKVEIKQIEHDKKFNILFDAITDKNLTQEKGIFFNGQIFDAYRFISDIIRTAKKSIILIDNYIDDSVLTMFTKRNKTVKVSIFTKNISRQLMLDLEKYNSQYPLIEIKEFKDAHDRFLIIDNKEVYHFGASLKDLGKKWFAFSRFEKDAFKILDKLGIK